jgi:hypothetical protein
MEPLYLTALGFLDLVGIGMFALSGALLAAQKRQDFVTFVFFAVVTGVGGGTVRDLLIGAPVFWVHENWILLICLGAALLAWFTPPSLWGRGGLVWADALGIAAYATYGAAKALAYGIAPLPRDWHGSPHRLPWRHIARCPGRRAVDFVAAGILRNRGGRVGRPDRCTEPGRRCGAARRSNCGARRLRAARRGDC